MILWKDMEMLCCSRRYRQNIPVTGAVYVVQSWDAKSVTLKLHEFYVSEMPAVESPVEEEPDSEAEGADDEAEESDPEELEESTTGKTSDVKSGDF